MKRERLYPNDSRATPAKSDKDVGKPRIRNRLEDQPRQRNHEESPAKPPRERVRLSKASAPKNSDHSDRARSKSTSVDHRGDAQSGPKVGPGNPPKQTRFRPGVSGNPFGRPKGSKNLATILQEAAARKVKATFDGKARRITTVQATAFQLATKAANGDPKAMSQYLDWLDEFERRAAARSALPYPLSADDECVIDELYERMLKSEPIEEGED